MALNKITVDSIAANAVTNVGIANGTIVTVDLADGAVTTTKIATGAVLGDKVGSNTIGTSNLVITGVTAGSYGNANTAVSMTVGADGRITYIANLASTASGSGVDAHPFFFISMGS